MGDVNILTIAMHDTTASTMAWCITELARRPALQEELRIEVMAVLSESSRDGEKERREIRKEKEMERKVDAENPTLLLLWAQKGLSLVVLKYVRLATELVRRLAVLPPVAQRHLSSILGKTHVGIILSAHSLLMASVQRSTTISSMQICMFSMIAHTQ